MPDSPVAVLTYFDGRGHGERVRYALAAGGVAYRENLLVKRGDVDAVRPRCAFGQVPLLEMPDGTRVVQSYAIVRFLGATAGPQPPAGAEHKADAALEQVRDFFVEAALVGFGWQADEAAKAAALDKVRAATSRYLPTFERALVAEGGRSIAGGEQPCWADFQLLYALDYACELLGEAVLRNAPQCAALRAALRALPRMAAFLASGAKPLVTQQYIREVREAQLPLE